jgi:pyridoxine 4-dehydrogenase
LTGNGGKTSSLSLRAAEAPNILLIAGTSSVDHLCENLKAADLKLEAERVQMLDSINSQPIWPYRTPANLNRT